MIAFIIKSCVSMVLFFGLYWFFLRKEKLLIFNRYFLIFSMVLSLGVPFISLPVNIGQNNTTSDLFAIINSPPAISAKQNEVVLPEQRIVPQGITMPTETPVKKERSTNLPVVLLFIYLSGFALMLIRFCRNILIVNRMFRRSEKIDNDWYRIALLEHPVNPFSFLRTVFINKKDYLENRIAENVLRHELEHVRQSHSRDIIFFELLHIVFWFNPVLFLYKRAARINHEYLADEAVIRTFSDMESYADELINFISTRVGVPLTSGFSPSMIRLRLLMLNTNTSRSGKGMRMMFTLLISILLMSFMSIKPADTDDQKQKVKNLNKDIVIDEVYFRGSDFNPLKTLVVMNGKKLGTDEKLIVDTRQIKTLDILKGRKAIRKYGRSAKNGVVVISTYENENKSAPDSIDFKTIYTLNQKAPDAIISIPVSNLYSLSIWTYPVFPNQDLRKRWRTIELMTRDYFKIRGKVVQTNGEPFPGVQLSVSDNPAKVRTDKDGRFSMEDVNQGVTAQLFAEGYDPFFFRVNSVVFTSELTITLDRKNDSDKNNISLNYIIKDFSGTWKYNNELSKPILPGQANPDYGYVYEIHQYDSDSILMKMKGTFENNRHYESTRTLAFNTVKTSPAPIDGNVKSTVSCSINPDGKSFSVSVQMKSKLGIFKGSTLTDIYSLSDDGNQMSIRQSYSSEGVSEDRQLIERVFERVGN